MSIDIVLHPFTNEHAVLSLPAPPPPSSMVVDAISEATAIGTPLGPIGKKCRFVGRAVTVEAGNLAQWKALELAGEGDVIVIASDGRRDRAEFGAIYVGIAKRKGVAAIVTDGLARDISEIASLDFPVFAAGAHPASPADPQQGSIGRAVRIDGCTIAAGDLIVGDEDGLVVVPAIAAGGLVAAIEKQARREHALHTDGADLPDAIVRALAGKRVGCA